jgi:EpsI family protein
MKTSNIRIVVVLSLFALTFVGLHTSQAVKATPIKRPLNQFPQEIGGWQFARKSFFSAPVIEMLGVEDYISYDYSALNGNSINLYISYFTAVGVHGGYHSPQNCLPGGGWNIASVEDVPLEVQSGTLDGATVKKVIVQKASEQQVVLYWFQNRGRIISSEYWEKIYLVLDAVLKQRRDGAFIRIIGQVPKGEDPEKFTRAMIEFAAKTAEAAAEFIPGE